MLIQLYRMKANKLLFEPKVLADFLRKEPPHLAMIRAIEGPFYQSYLPFKGKVLDIGCGDGFFAWSVFHRQKITLGIDIAASLWQEALRRGNYEKVVVYDGKKIPAKDHFFDVIICNCVLEHIPHAAEMFNEMYRVLKRDGKILITVVTENYGKHLLGTTILGIDYTTWMNHKAVHVANVSPEKWEAQIKKAGFMVEKKVTYFNSNLLMKWFDITHYWGIINILTRKIMGKWVWGPSRLSNIIWGKIFTFFVNYSDINNDVPYLFMVAKK